MLKTIAVLIACHNRKDQTLNCLQALFNQIGMGIAFKLEVFLVDDGCTDGTAEAIRQQFPQVTIIKGTGNLYWNRGMHLAWKVATETNFFDYYLWLNDDTFLFENAIKKKLEAAEETQNQAAICGSTFSLESKKISYGGNSKEGIQPVDCADKAPMRTGTPMVCWAKRSTAGRYSAISGTIHKCRTPQAKPSNKPSTKSAQLRP
jgi:GT2 family glycosyltransferase